MQLPSIGVAPEFISFKNVSLESERYICVRETGAQNNVVIVDMASPLSPARRQITADSALMCLDKKVIALKAAATGGDALQVFNLDTKTKLAAHQMPEPVEFWKWISPTTLGLVTASSVYHWTVEVSECFAQKQQAITTAPASYRQCCTDVKAGQEGDAVRAGKLRGSMMDWAGVASHKTTGLIMASCRDAQGPIYMPTGVRYM